MISNLDHELGTDPRPILDRGPVAPAPRASPRSPLPSPPTCSSRWPSGRRGGDRLRVAGGGGGALLGGYGQRGHPADRQPTVATAPRSRSPSRPWPGGLRLVVARRARPVRGRGRRLGHARGAGARATGAGERLHRGVCRARGLVRARRNLVPALGPAGPTRSRVVTAG